MTNKCNHQRSVSIWHDEFENDWGYTEPGHWEYTTVQTTEDIDIGRYRCTQCGEVMYYTGTWRKHWEGT
jgi:hypothetical protein